jgi:hypothetical protein
MILCLYWFLLCYAQKMWPCKFANTQHWNYHWLVKIHEKENAVDITKIVSQIDGGRRNIWPFSNNGLNWTKYECFIVKW